VDDRQRLEQRLGRRVPDWQWQEVDERYGADIAATGGLPLRQAADYAEGLARGSRRAAKPSGGNGDQSGDRSRAVPYDEERIEPDGRTRALSALALVFATNDDQVKRWRAKYRPDGAERWYDSLTEREWEHLQDVARYLADRYKWDVNDAVRFLGVDREPTVLTIKATLRASHDGAALPGSYALGSDPADPEAGTWRFPWRNRVELSVDPNVTPAQLAEYWLRLRKRVVVGSRRPPKPRSLKLVAFLAGRANEDTGFHMKAWNAEHPDERYSQGSHFLRDARSALIGLCESEPFLWPDG